MIEDHENMRTCEHKQIKKQTNKQSLMLDSKVVHEVMTLICNSLCFS